MPINDKPALENKTNKIIPQSITEEMQESYLDYAMSVIIGRALPDVRDGLKPVHRRILYAMWDIGLKADAKFRKSATVVGEVLGKYHPHGDVAVYDSMVRMAQNFAMRYPLINGQGNFGSLDGDNPAAMRYTEAKLASIAEQLLTDLEKNTVEFLPNYDGSQKEPQVLPARLPNLLLNGGVGIAVGMATTIPPHNLGEICQATSHLIDHPDASIEDLMEFIKGPDFPTGGLIYNKKDILETYSTGKGSIVMRAKTEIQETKNGQFQIIVNEIPFQINKASLVEKIANLVKEKKIEHIKDLRDESNKDGVRIVIDLKKDSYPKKILNRLFKLTSLQETFHVNMLALVDGIQPRVLNLKRILEEYISHQQVIIRRKTEYDLEKARDRAHILKGLKIALDKIDAVIRIIKKSRDRETARVNLMKNFKLTERQAVAILEMKLQQLANLERLKIEQELKEKLDLIKELEIILASPVKILNLIKDNLTSLQQKFGDARRTKIISGPVGEFSQEDLIPNEATVITITRDGYIKRIPPETFKTQARGGKGIIGLTTKETDVVENCFVTNTHFNVLFFTSRGRVFQLKAYEIPAASRTAKGQAIVNFLQLGPNEKVSVAFPLNELGDFKYLFMATKKGLIKKIDLQSLANIRRSGLIIIKLGNDDFLEWVKPCTGKDEVILVSAKGQTIRFKEKDVRTMGRNAAGVRGMRLKNDDFVIAMDVLDNQENISNLQLLVISENGMGKRTFLKNYKIQHRGGSGIKTAKITQKTGNLIGSRVINTKTAEEDIIIVSRQGQVIRLPLKSVSVLGRATQGVRLMRFKEGNDKVASLTFI